MSNAEIGSVVAVLVALISGGFTFIKTRAEAGNITVTTATDVVALVRTELKRVNKALAEAEAELAEQRRRRHEIEAEVHTLEHRVQKLELWITANTEVDPASINGWPV